MTEAMQIRRFLGREATRHEIADQNHLSEAKTEMADKKHDSNQESKKKKNIITIEEEVIKEEEEVKIKGKMEEEGSKPAHERRRKSSEGGSKGNAETPRRGSIGRQIKIPYLAQIERRISMDILDYSGKLEGVKLIRELNRETSHYRHLAVALGGSSDCEQLREDLRKSRQRATDLVRQAKTKLLPCLQEPHKFSSSDRKEAKRLCKLLFYCIRVLEQELLRTLTLQSSFTLYSGNISLINTGVNEYLASHKSSPPPAQGTDQALKDRLLAEKNEVLALQKEASEIRSYLYKNDGSPGVKSWNMEDYGEKQFLHTIIEDSDPSSVSSPASPFPNNESGISDQESLAESFREKLHHRRCLCWIFASLLTILLVASLVGTLISFLFT